MKAKKPSISSTSTISPFSERVEDNKVDETPRSAAAAGAFEHTTTDLPKAAKLIPAPVAVPKRPRKSKTAAGIDPFAELAGTSPVKKDDESSSPRKAVSPKKARKTMKPRKTSSTPPKKTTPTVASDTASVAVALAIPELPPSPVFKALAEVSLPPLKKENRARLLLQSPTKLYFYWSMRDNPWKRLRDVFGDASNSYTLVLKLTDLSRKIDEMYAAEPAGDRWFDAAPDSEYQAEIGFYAPNRPYFRLIHSNVVSTPRRSPSPHPASDARWTVSANKFAEVLDVSGFTRDAVDVAIAGDDPVAAHGATHLAFSDLVGGGDFTSVPTEDLRYAMLSLAAGLSTTDLRTRVSGRIYSAVEKLSGVSSAQRSRDVLKKYFHLDEEEWNEEGYGPAVHGASLIHFPKTLRSRKAAFSPRYNPVGSHSIG